MVSVLAVPTPEGLHCADFYPAYASQHHRHLAVTERHLSRGSRFTFLRKRPFVNGLLSMVEAKEGKYRQYFAQSPGPSDKTQTTSTDKSKGKSNPPSKGSSSVHSSVGFNGKSKSPSTEPHSKAGVTTPETQSSPSALPHSPGSSRPQLSELRTDSFTHSMDPPTPPVSRDASPEPQVVAQALLNKKKKEIVEKLMLDVFHPLFNKWMDEIFGAMRQAVHDAESSGQTGSYQAGGRDSKKASRSRKRQQREDDHDDGPDDNDDGEDGGRKGTPNKRSRRGSDAKLMFACPYFKRNPLKFGAHRTCCGPGWYDVHRVKEHLYRRHQPPEFECDRCGAVFKDGPTLKAHHRTPTPCSLKTEQNRDGSFDRAQEKQLRARCIPGSSERSKWEEMYRVLFPGERIPSPYHDEAEKSTNDKTLDAYEQYFNREFPDLARRELGRALDQQLDAAQENLKPLVVEIVTDLQLKMLRTFKFARARHTPPVSPRVSTPAPAAAPAQRLSMPLRPPTPPPEALLTNPGLLDGLDPEFADLMDNFDLAAALQYVEPLGYDGTSNEPDSGYVSLSRPLGFDGAAL